MTQDEMKNGSKTVKAKAQNLLDRLSIRSSSSEQRTSAAR
jgi:hypothetical protein